MGRTYVRRPAQAGIPAALAPHHLFSTCDPSSAERLVTPFVGPCRLSTAADEAGFRITFHGVVTGRLVLGHLRVDSSTVLELRTAAGRFLVVEPDACGVGVRCGAVSFEATPRIAAGVQPDRATTMCLPAGAGALVVGIEREAVHAHLSRLLGRSLDHPLVFEPRMDLGAGCSSRWNLAVEMLQDELADDGSLLRSGIGQAQVEEFLMSSLLYGHRSSYSDVLARPTPPMEGGATATARGFIEANLAHHLPLAAVATAAGVSVRTLQAAFRSELRTTPTAYIRSCRLDRARADLAAATRADPVTVTDVATRWGLSHLGRFAAEYRRRFGESPSQTLRRPAPTRTGNWL